MNAADVGRYLRANGLRNLTWALWVAYFFLNGILIGRATLQPIILTLTVMGLAVWVYTRRNPVKLDPTVRLWVILAFALLGFFVVYGLFAGQLAAFQEHRYDHFLVILLLPFLAILLAYLKPDAETVFKILVVAGLFALYYSIRLVSTQDELIRGGPGLLGKAIIRGNLGMFSAVLSLVAIFALRDWRWKALAFITFVSGVTLSILSSSRGGWLAMFIGVFTLAWITRKPHPRVFRAVMLILLGVGVAVVAFWNVLPIEARIMEAIDDFRRYRAGDVVTSVGYRLQMWNLAWHAFLDKPLFGQGLDTFNSLWRSAIKDGIAKGEESFMHTHNDYLMALSQTGLAGFILVMTWLLYPVRPLFKVAARVPHDNEANRFLAISGLIMVEALLKFILTNNAFYTRPLFEAQAFGLLLVLSALSGNHRTHANQEPLGSAP